MSFQTVPLIKWIVNFFINFNSIQSLLILIVFIQHPNQSKRIAYKLQEIIIHQRKKNMLEQQRQLKKIYINYKYYFILAFNQPSNKNQVSKNHPQKDYELKQHFFLYLIGLCYIFTSLYCIFNQIIYNTNFKNMSKQPHANIVNAFLNKLFSQYDQDHNRRFTRSEFPKVIKVLSQLIGADQATEDDVDDIFNLIDINGDQTIDRAELQSLIKTFLKVLEQQNIEIKIAKESDMIQ